LKIIFPLKSGSLHKRDRLRSQKIIETLFHSKHYFIIYPFRIYWSKETSNNPSLQMAVSVPKKLQKKAVNRNLMKRRIREAYRRKKTHLMDSLVQSQHTLRIFLVYTTENRLTYHDIEKKIELIIEKLENKK